MHPELFHIGNITIYTYAFLIALGTLVASIYTKWSAKRELGIFNLSNNFFYLIFIAGFVGGKLFYYLEKPLYFLRNPTLMLDNFSGGFVFYGSFITIILMLLWYLKKHKIPVLPMLDILAITTTIVHVIGRMGCFFAGCCYGKPTDSFMGMDFPRTKGVLVHPSQLYEIVGLLSIMIILFIVKKKKQFQGQIFLIYIALYAIVRGFLEFFRGDNRGFIIDGVLSHSQFIAVLILITSLLFYKKKQINY
ncbi:MAG: prolipoprotein diacylglyceryl transferase [Flavobacteriaceae bacterium]|nr:MAG: prolipoprotein diacylglyceryl transferase [Flavobacteriaceae bacterium]